MLEKFLKTFRELLVSEKSAVTSEKVARDASYVLRSADEIKKLGSRLSPEQQPALVKFCDAAQRVAGSALNQREE